MRLSAIRGAFWVVPVDTVLDILIPTYRRPGALAVTLAGLAAQTMRDFRLVVSDQTEDESVLEQPEVRSVVRVLRVHGHEVRLFKHLPRRGMAEQRQFLLGQAMTPYCLFLDDDVLLEPDIVERMLGCIQRESCGFVGCAVLGLSYLADFRPHEQEIEFWEGRVQPEEVLPGSPAWQRHRLHSAANLFHVQHRLGLTRARERRYRVAWVGGCVLYDTFKLRSVDGFSFWDELPNEHCGEDVLAQLRVMARFGGCGIIPSGAYHLELSTTVVDRKVNAPLALRSTNGPVS
ncbi:MAG: glycosyltransferase [Chloroflexi bacterium]|nr:glycosyltransferase [Chloroflexota bacterium]